MAASIDHVVVMKCDCKHADQDKFYGPNLRAHNPAPQKGASPNRVRCTVCRREKNAGTQIPSSTPQS